MIWMCLITKHSQGRNSELKFVSHQKNGVWFWAWSYLLLVWQTSQGCSSPFCGEKIVNLPVCTGGEQDTRALVIYSVSYRFVVLHHRIWSQRGRSILDSSSSNRDVWKKTGSWRQSGEWFWFCWCMKVSFQDRFVSAGPPFGGQNKSSIQRHI